MSPIASESKPLAVIVTWVIIAALACLALWYLRSWGWPGLVTVAITVVVVGSGVTLWQQSRN